MEKKFRVVFGVLLSLAVFALGLSYFVEYGYGMRPCTYCSLQRWVYMILIPLSLMGIFVPYKRGILRAVQGVLMAGFLVAAIHSVKEFQGGSCGCSEKAPSWKILGLPAPLYNGVVSLVLLVGTQVFVIRTRKGS